MGGGKGKQMKLWIDDVRPAPKGYIWCTTVNEAKMVIRNVESLSFITHNWNVPKIELLDVDHDAGDCVPYGGDYIKLLDWIEETGRNYPIRIHSMNPVGVENMRAIIERNGWTEVK